ncbi:tyrosine-type recombinase/integrase [Brevundimonas sp. GCM10030266]|uniref:tyrosine-type recombinase/integrase n=1 Tax=Brevundimonas sp. GCM10030266 TaxID=3273386 RepID=UPI003618B403
MSRVTNRLTSRGALAIRAPGMHADGRGLYLRVDQAGGRSWVLIYHLNRRRREMGLGGLDAVGLGRARELAEEAREAVRRGDDPILMRKAAKAPPQGRTFEAVASDVLDELEKGWKSPKSRPQWEASLTQHAPAIWKADVAEVDTDMVLECLKPIWTTLPETARRVRGRIERVLDAAKVKGLRTGENPARWGGHLAVLLASTRAMKKHHAAMPYAEVPAFITKLASRESISALALRFIILTACRSGEVRGALWSEIKGDVWIVPASRMKAKAEHRVPLSDAALAVLAEIPVEARRDLIFPGTTGNALTDAAVSKVLRINGQAEATVHGFRSSFRDWGGDCTTHSREVLEQALAHRVGDATERAYRRRDAFEKRRMLMDAWADHCLGRSGRVIQMKDRA